MTVLLAGNVSAESNAFGGASPTNSGNWKQRFRPMTMRSRWWSQDLLLRGYRKDMLAVWPSAYPNESFLDELTLDGDPGDPSGHIKRETIELHAID